MGVGNANSSPSAPEPLHLPVTLPGPLAGERRELCFCWRLRTDGRKELFREQATGLHCPSLFLLWGVHRTKASEGRRWLLVASEHLQRLTILEASGQEPAEVGTERPLD